MILALCFTAGALFELLMASLIGRMFKAADRSFARHVDQALHLVPAQRRAEVMAAHPAGGRDQAAWDRVAGSGATVTRIGKWMNVGITSDPNDPRLTRGADETPGPQAPVYLVLSEEERAKGFIRPVRRKYVHTGACGALTTMGLALCETYARDPHFYGSTYCCGCQMHRPVGEFRWDEDGQVVGS